MLVNVPQYIDVEDKIAGPLTAKQLGWMFAMGAVLLVIYNILEKVAFFVAAIPVIIVFVLLAFYRPNGRPLVSFIGSGFSFMFQPKVYVWKRNPDKIMPPKTDVDQKKVTEQNNIQSGRSLAAENIHDFAQILDTEGMEKSAKVEELLRKRNLDKK